MAPRPCCADRANRVAEVVAPETVAAAALRGGVPGREVCRVCGTTHYSLTVTPGRIGVDAPPPAKGSRAGG
jgi:hypothetical protein